MKKPSGTGLVMELSNYYPAHFHVYAYQKANAFCGDLTLIEQWAMSSGLWIRYLVNNLKAVINILNNLERSWSIFVGINS